MRTRSIARSSFINPRRPVSRRLQPDTTHLTKHTATGRMVMVPKAEARHVIQVSTFAGVQQMINTPEDMQWLRDVHIPDLSLGFKSAVIYGNVDYPYAVCVYEAENPSVDDTPVTYMYKNETRPTYNDASTHQTLQRCRAPHRASFINPRRAEGPLAADDTRGKLLSDIDLYTALGLDNVVKTLKQELQKTPAVKKGSRRRQAAFMQPMIEQGTWVMVDGGMGVDYIPAGETDPEDVEALRQEIAANGKASTGGTSLEDFTQNDVITEIEVVEGYSAYLSAPGYMDRTENTVFPTEEEAKEYLINEYPESFDVGITVLNLAEELEIDTKGLEDYQIEEEMGDELFRLVAFGEADDDMVENWLRTYFKQPDLEAPRTSSARRRRRSAAVDLSKWNISKLIAAGKNALDTIGRNPDRFRSEGDDEFYEYYLEDISSGAAGRYQPEEIASFFDLEDKDWGEDYEWFWEGIDRIVEPIAAALSAELTKAGVPGHIYFGHLEADGSYGIFYAVGADELEPQDDGLDEPDTSTDPKQLGLPHTSSARRRRASASFQNYAEAWGVAQPLLEQKAAEVRAELESLVAELKHEGLNASVIGPSFDDTDDYQLMLTLEVKNEAGEMDDGLSVDVDIALADATNNDGTPADDPEWGVNVNAQITFASGELIGGYAPMNYTHEVWTRDPDELERRIQGLNPATVLRTVTTALDAKL